jgi:hypothetical protein
MFGKPSRIDNTFVEAKIRSLSVECLAESVLSSQDASVILYSPKSVVDKQRVTLSRLLQSTSFQEQF